MEFLAKHLWHSFKPDLASGAALFLSALNGAKDTDYQCLRNVDKKALLAEWAQADQEKAHREYAALITAVPGHRDADRCAELCAAFQYKNQRRFREYVKEGLSALYRDEG